MTEERFAVQAAVDGNLSLSDLRMDPEALAHQAAVAKAGEIRSWPKTSCAQPNSRPSTTKQ